MPEFWHFDHTRILDPSGELVRVIDRCREVVMADEERHGDRLAVDLLGDLLAVEFVGVEGEVAVVDAGRALRIDIGGAAAQIGGARGPSRPRT